MISDRFTNGFNSILSQAGTSVLIRYFDQIYDEVYDEPGSLTESGTLWVSGIILPLNKREGSEDSVLLEQGKLQDKDKRLYVNGSINFSTDTQTISVQVGSPTGETYTTIPLGAYTPEVNGTQIYKRQFIRRLTGSLI